MVLAETDRIVRLEGNDYFPPESLSQEYFQQSRTFSVCPWKGLARYYTVTANGGTNRDAAWYYPRPSPLARRIKGHVAFWNGVQVERIGDQEDASRRPGEGGPMSRLRRLLAG